MGTNAGFRHAGQPYRQLQRDDYGTRDLQSLALSDWGFYQNVAIAERLMPDRPTFGLLLADFGFGRLLSNMEMGTADGEDHDRLPTRRRRGRAAEPIGARSGVLNDGGYEGDDARIYWQD